MDFHVMTLFPDMIMQGLSDSVIGRAVRKGTIGLHTVNIRDYSLDKHKHVDDYPYGGGAGMVMQPEPIYACYQDIVGKMDKKPRVIYMTPQGRVFSQEIAEELSKEESGFTKNPVLFLYLKNMSYLCTRNQKPTWLSW